jgi:hypothetical protein
MPVNALEVKKTKPGRLANSRVKIGVEAYGVLLDRELANVYYGGCRPSKRHADGTNRRDPRNGSASLTRE